MQLLLNTIPLRMNPDQLGHYAAEASSLVATGAPTIIGAIVTLILGLWVIKWLMKIINRGFVSSKLDITVSKFLSSLISIGLKVLLLVSVAGMFGVQTTSFVALLGAAGLAVGIALQGSLSNFAGGVLILMFTPYKIGDLVDIQGVKGHVLEIGILNTTITTLDNNTAVIPNGPIINNNIINLSTKDSIRVDVAVGIAYDENIDTTREVLTDILEKNTYILDHPSNGIFVSELADSSVNLIVRGYSTPESYWPAYFSLTEDCKKALDTAGISIPFPHRVIHTTTDEI